MPAKRRRHVPLRTCIACRQQRAKRDLVRVVRTPEGTIEIDSRGKRSGRGAYLCPSHQCLERALTEGILGRALRCQVTAEQVGTLKSVVGEMLEGSSSAEPASDGVAKTEHQECTI